MTSVNKEWKNPSDIMKTHLMQRHSSFSLTKTRSASNDGMNRRHSFTMLSQNSSDSQLRHSLGDTSIHTQSTGSQKRKNPFGCDKILNKRRSILDEEIRAENLSSTSADDSYHVIPAACYTTENQTDSNRETDSAVELKQNKLLHALSMQEQRENILLQQKKNCLSRKDIETTVKMKHPLDILKEKPVSSNTEIATSKVSMEHMKVCVNPPVDWSLKSKVRVVVHSSVGSFKKYPGIDAKNVDSYVHHKLDISHEWKDLDVLQQIRRCCMHYSYPHLPWLSTFPRLSTDFKSRSSSVIASNNDILESLQKDWSCTFTSIYQQLRGGLCPYFYVCAHQFSVLFRCLRSADSTSWSALLSPSTRGLREMLTKEGIEFRMPNIRTTKPVNSNKQKENEVYSNIENDSLPASQPDDNMSDGAANENSQKENNPRDITNGSVLNGKDDSSDDENDIEGDDEASRWLEGMGLDKKDFPSLEPFKVKLQREGFREIDNRPQSLVYVEGVDVHSFFNFLLNYPGCIACSGPQHGIPPTILSPVSFVGGRLVQNVVKHTTLSSGLANVSAQLDSLGRKSTHVFEISGPILPHHALNIASILHRSPDCESSTVSFSTHSPSAAFNTQTENNAEKDKLASGLSKLFVEFSQANSGFLQDVRNQLLASPVLETSTAVREMHVFKSGYSWTC